MVDRLPPEIAFGGRAVPQGRPPHQGGSGRERAPRRAALCPEAVAPVLAVDLIPDDTWCWFVLGDAGRDGGESLDPSIAIRAAEVLGALQSGTVADRTLANQVPHCRGGGLWAALADCAAWAAHRATPELRDRVRDMHRRLLQAEGWVRGVERQLLPEPDAVVHGDLWAGNVAVQGDQVRLLDWGDAAWGVGGVSIIHLLASEDGRLDAHAGDIWAAYEVGLGRGVSRECRSASAFAHRVTRLVVDREIATCCGRGLDRLRGFLPTLEALLEPGAAGPGTES